jgi:hypothetical protein
MVVAILPIRAGGNDRPHAESSIRPRSGVEWFGNSPEPAGGDGHMGDSGQEKRDDTLVVVHRAASPPYPAERKYQDNRSHPSTT